MAWFATLINILLFTTYYIGTFVHMWQSWVWSFVAAIILAGGASQNIFFAFLAYPALEYYILGKLTIFSALSVGLNLLLAIAIFVAYRFGNKKYYTEPDEWG